MKNDDQSKVIQWLQISRYKERFNTICKQSDICGPKTRNERNPATALVWGGGDTHQSLLQRGLYEKLKKKIQEKILQHQKKRKYMAEISKEHCKKLEKA